MKFTSDQRWFIGCLVAGAAFVGLAIGEKVFDEIFEYSSEDTAKVMVGLLGAALIIGAVLGWKFLQLVENRSKSR